MSNSPYLLSLSDDTVSIHDEALRLAEPPPLFDPSATAFASNADAIAIATSSGLQGGRIRVVHPSSPHHNLNVGHSAVTKLALSPDSQFLAAAYPHNTVHLFNLSSNEQFEFPASSRVLSLSFDSNNSILSICTPKTIILLSVTDFEQLSDITPTSATRSFPRATTLRTSLTCAAFSPIKPLLASSDDTGCVTIYDTTTPSSLRTRARFTSALRTPATTMAFSSTGVLAVAGFDKHIRLYDSALKNLLFSIAIAAPATALSFRDDVLAFAGTDSSIALIQADVNDNSFAYIARSEAPQSHTGALLLCPPSISLSTTPKHHTDNALSQQVDPLSKTFSDVEGFLSRLPPLPPDKHSSSVSKRLTPRRSMPILSTPPLTAQHDQREATELPVHLSASFLTDEQDEEASGSPPSSAGTSSPLKHLVPRKHSHAMPHDSTSFGSDHSSRENSPLLASIAEEEPERHRNSEEFFDGSASVLREAGVTRVPEEGSNNLIHQFRSMLRQEMDVIRTDLHSDILGIHSEIVLLATTQSQELKSLVKERDERVSRLENEVRRLKADNLRLRKKYELS